MMARKTNLFPSIISSFSLASCLTIVLAQAAFGQEFTLGFTGPSTVTVGGAGCTGRTTYTATLTHQGAGTGAQGWSYGIQATGGTFVSVDCGPNPPNCLAGTDAGALFDNGFQ